MDKSKYLVEDNDEFVVTIPFTIKVEKEYCDYKFDTFTFNVGDVITFNYPFGLPLNCIGFRLIDRRITEYKNYRFITGFCGVDIEQRVKKRNLYKLENDDLRALLAKLFEVSPSEIKFVQTEDSYSKPQIGVEIRTVNNKDHL